MSLKGRRGNNAPFVLFGNQKSNCKIVPYSATWLTYLFFILQVLVFNLYLIVKYQSRVGFENFTFANAIQMLWSTVGILLFTTVYKSIKPTKANYGTILMGTLVCAVGILITQFIIVRIVFISIPTIDLFFFQMSTAISEEFLFRFGLQTFTERYLQTHLGVPKIKGNFKLFNRESNWCNTVAGILSILIISTAFGIYHYFAKGGDWTLVLATLVSGIVLGLTLYITKNIDSCILAHLIVNVGILIYDTPNFFQALISGG